MKKLINDPRHVVQDMLEGLVLANPALALLKDENVVVRQDYPALAQANKVALVSGGGAGHEPAHAGYVGAGMLTAAVAGEVFTSPSVDAVLSAILTVAGPAGVLLIVKHYTGDRLNFGLAAELARATGVEVELLLVGDDVALDGNASVGRRGIAGTVLIHKVAGAAAEAGLPLLEVKALAERAAAGLFSMGLGLTACTVPAAGKPGFSIGDAEVEYGLGIHGESGVRRAPIQPAAAMVASLLDRIVAQGELQPGQRVALLVNNLGGTPSQEVDIVTREALLGCKARGLVVDAVMAGTFLSALDMAGCSLSLMRVDDACLTLLQAPTEAGAWPGMRRPASSAPRIPVVEAPVVAERSTGHPWAQAHAMHFKAALLAIAGTLREHEAELTELDAVVGDGDIGISLARGAAAIEQQLSQLDAGHPAAALQQLSGILRKALGGTSGPLYAVFTLAAGMALARAADPSQPHAWSTAFDAGAEAIMRLGGARAGERTMLDALLPAAAAFRGGHGALAEVLAATAEAARQGAEATRTMQPRKGRSSYLGDRVLGHVDPGAYAVYLWLASLARL